MTLSDPQPNFKVKPRTTAALQGLLATAAFLWPPNRAAIIFWHCGFLFFSLPILSGRRFHVYHIPHIHVPYSTHDVCANASTSSPALPVNESTFQVPTRNPQPFRSLSALMSSWTQPSALAQGCAAFWLGFPTSCLHRQVGVPTGWYPIIVLFPTIIFWTLMVQGKTTEVDTPTVQLGSTLSELISEPPQSSPIFTPDALPATTLPIYPSLGQAQEYAGLHTPWLG